MTHAGAEFQSVKLSYTHPRYSRSVQLEYLLLPDSTSLSLILQGPPLSFDSDTHQIPLNITIADQITSSIQYIREGGQRIIFDTAVQSTITEALLSDQEVMISFAKHQLIITPESFSKLYFSKRSPFFHRHITEKLQLF